ncbi:MAG TPA: VOC family protein [Candidatus Acutalibacter stercorigallinarum]|nr:VOC family protein [Candidatus Acutalibacter stercorigallinarum]
MSKLIQGVHHIALKPTAEQYSSVVELYTKVLGMEVTKSWGDPNMPCLMVSCGDNSCLEIIPEKEMSQKGGALNHLALATDKVDEAIARVREAGYEIAIEPNDMELAGSPIRIAFFWGPMNEYIELFWEK